MSSEANTRAGGSPDVTWVVTSSAGQVVGMAATS